MMILLLFFCYFSSVLPVPLELRKFDRLISSVVRKVGQSDVINPSVCPPSCEHLHNALNFRQRNNSCSCICPPSRPTYLSSVGGCVAKLNDCENSVSWKGVESTIPIVELHPHTIILPDHTLDFEGAGVRISEQGDANCSITRIVYENVHTRWKSLARGNELFQLTSTGGNPILYFGGTEFDASFLAGAVVAVKLECRTLSSQHVLSPSASLPICVSIRVAGVSGSNLPEFGPEDLEPEGWRVESIFLLIVISLVIIVLIITFIVWNICWSIKKRQLISDFQLQFVQQYRLQRANQVASEDVESPEISPQPVNRKRLIFSADYLDPLQMTDPSPLAQQFLFDLRRVVDVAKDRIRQRRFLPSLEAIEESDFEIYLEEIISPNNSPQSEPKSVDSGRGEDDSESENEEEENEEKNEKNGQKSVQEIVKKFERPSMVPIMLNSSMRRKKPQQLSVTPEQSEDLTENVKKPPFQSRIRPPTSFRSTKGKGYAVFPSDGTGTFNKSLPRRSKPKKIPTSN